MTMRTLLLVVLLGGTVSLRAEDVELGLRVVDAESGEPLAARVYLSGAGQPFYFTASGEGRTVRYAKQNWINARSTEYHTCISAHRCVARVPAGEYRVEVHRGQAYRPFTARWEVPASGAEKVVRLKRWVDPAARGWYSGDTHIHRTIDELRTIQLAEDLNVTFPLTNWVTFSDRLPASGDKSETAALPEGLVEMDETHVLWPRNTEYEIFTVGGKRHTLGALFVLGHAEPLSQTVPPWEKVVRENQAPGVLFDMDKLDWPFSMLLPTITPGALYELANNHTWRTEFAFRKWNTAAPSYLQPPFGAQEGGHRAWLDYTMGMYYTLLNCGFRLPPTAGTANGVHPVPAGFGRVYVHLESGFRYEDWVAGLAQGRSFVSTGPMLFAQAAGKHPGHVFKESPGAEIPLQAEILTTAPISYAELLWNGRPLQHWRGARNPGDDGGYRMQIETSVKPPHSGWFAIRCWQERADGNTRFAHSAPWYVQMDDDPVRPTPAERDYLVSRMEEEIARSRDIVSPTALAEYRQALALYRDLPVREDAELQRWARPVRDAGRRQQWLENMVVHHRFTADEVRAVLGISREQAQHEIARLTEKDGPPMDAGRLRVLPYPGGRHPRRGFLEGALRPQRDTKVSIFPPWDDGGYVVVDVPEAVFSNLGLTYLAHTHIPTIWDTQGVQLPAVEWQREAERLTSTRRLPNGIELVSRVQAVEDEVQMEITLHNGTSAGLNGLRVQVCTMLKGAVGFQVQERLEQLTRGDLLAVKAPESNRWIVTGWTPRQRSWTNPPVPCFHVDPQFPDCAPGQTVRVQGRLFFYEGDDIAGELERRQ